MNYVIIFLNYLEHQGILETYYIIIETKNDYDMHKIKLAVTHQE